jgi:hypothetical protein
MMKWAKSKRSFLISLEIRWERRNFWV